MFFKNRSFAVRFLALVAAIGSVSLLFSKMAQIDYDPLPSIAAPISTPTPMTVVIDAGHGGEDGGTVSANGVCEKDINLKIAFLLCDMLKANGIRVVMTRTEDVLLYDRNENYQGRKKVLDLAARREIAEAEENCIFVSIHLNAFPLTQYKGLQVWYSPNDPASESLAESIRSTVKEHLQPDNDRAVKRATSSIYLLHRLQCPAVLVECGFLSNPEEATLLNTEEYQKQIALLLFSAIIQRD